jgi:hypothetical protein
MASPFGSPMNTENLELSVGRGYGEDLGPGSSGKEREEGTSSKLHPSHP